MVAKDLYVVLKVDDRSVRPLLERAAGCEILLTDTVEWMQRFILILEQSAPAGDDPFSETLGELRFHTSRIQALLDSGLKA